MDERRLEEIVKKHQRTFVEGYYLRAAIREAIREAISSQEEERVEALVDERKRLVMKHLRHEAHKLPAGTFRDDVFAHLRGWLAQEEALRSLREERDSLEARHFAAELRYAGSQELLKGAQVELQRLREAPDPVEAFYAAVNKRAEADMLEGKPVTGAHHRSLEAEIAAYRLVGQVPGKDE